MRLALGVPLLLIGCAAGGRPFEPQPEPDASLPKDTMPEIPPADAMVLEPDAAPTPDSSATPDTAPDACIPQVTEVLLNANLDGAPISTGWTEVQLPNLPGGPYPIILADGVDTGPPAATAPNKAWMGGAAGIDATPITDQLTDALFQQITFPADATTFVVSGMFVVGGVEDQDDIYDTFRLDVTDTNGTPIENVLTLDNLTPSASFAPFTKTLTTNFAGQTVQLRATSTNDEINHTNFFLDSLSFQATFCPP